jgi:glycosyltransferase involved in cell wall biosynthesis
MELTIAIITKNRITDLEKCLASIFKQEQCDFSVLIIDNDTEKTALPVYKRFKHRNKFPIRYICEPSRGYSNARNCALGNCKLKYLAFVDDDCVLDKNWGKSGLRAIKKYDSIYVVGRTIQVNRKSLFAEVEQYIYYNWMPDYYDKTTYEIDALRIDTKNIIFNASRLKSKKLQFDTRFNTYGGEDTDLGLQIKQCNLKGYYVPTMFLYHKGKLDAKAFIKKSFAYGYNCYNLYHKWSHLGECTNWDMIDGYRFYLKPKKLLNDYYCIKQNNRLKKLCYFFLIKLFNSFFIKGHYVKKRQLQNQ